MTVDLSGHEFDNAGTAITTGVIDIFTVATGADDTTPSASATVSTTTDATGLWDELNIADGAYDVRITANSEIRWLRGEDRVQLSKLTVDNIQVRDAGDLFFGAGEDAALRWSTGDADNHALTVGLGDSNQALHVTDLAAIATDWNIAATTHPNLYIHSNTTPATDYLRLGGHTGTVADIDVVGGTTLRLMVAGAVQATITAAILNLPSGNTYQINATDVLSATTLGTGVLTSSLTTVGALNSGSITSGFGGINNGSSTFNTGAATVVSLSVSDGNITNVGSISLDSIISDAGAAITLNPTTDTLVANATGLIVGHTAQITAAVANEFQVLGTDTADSSMLIAGFSTSDGMRPQLQFLKSGNATIGSNTTVADDEALGGITWHGADGTDLATNIADILVNVDDGSPGAGAIGGEIILRTATTGGTMTTAFTLTSSQNVQVDNGILLVGDTANANQTLGLTINQGANDNHILVLKSSDVATGLTTLPRFVDVETDDFFTIDKGSATVGGVGIQVLAESTLSTPLFLETWGGAPDTTDTSGSNAAMNFYVGEHDGSNGGSDMAANSNAFAWGEMEASTSRVTRMLLKADDGELHLGNGNVATLDDEDDALVVRAMQKASSSSGIVESEYDNPFYDYNWLRAQGLAGEKDKDGFFLFPLQTRLNIHEATMWQLYTRLMDTTERLLSMEKKLLALGGS